MEQLLFIENGSIISFEKGPITNSSCFLGAGVHDCFGPLSHLFVPQSKRHPVLALMWPGKPFLRLSLKLDLSSGRDSVLTVCQQPAGARQNLPLPPSPEGDPPHHRLPPLRLRRSPALWGKEGRLCPNPPLHGHRSVRCGSHRPLRNCFRKWNQHCIHCVALSPTPPGNQQKHMYCSFIKEMCLTKAGLGVLVYLLRFPENLLPAGAVDLWGSSHQLWHALIFSGDSSSNGQMKMSFLPGMLSWYCLDP